MHELSICRSIYTIVERARAGRAVAAVHLEVGALRQVVPATLEHCWLLLTEQTPLAGSRLAATTVPIELRCASCCATTPAPDRLMLVCRRCGSGRVTVVRGEELIVTTMDVREESEPAYG